MRRNLQLECEFRGERGAGAQHMEFWFIVSTSASQLVCESLPQLLVEQAQGNGLFANDGEFQMVFQNASHTCQRGTCSE
jgi:hypothetical protein